MRPIDADKIPYTMLYKENWLKGSGVEAQGAWKEDIDAMPTIEPQRKPGRWIFWEDDPDANTYECSECGEPYMLEEGTPKDNKYYFCPCCGSSMGVGHE